MMVRIGEAPVDVVDAICARRPCYQFGFDKGAFVQGRGYVRYHKTALRVCQTRHLHGCPEDWVCPAPCRTVQLPLVETCRYCGASRPAEAMEQP